ncbi:hypothetical protein CC2G_000923 [Coprinopsis cinerea AmutBmut pab1-1]|nr:hypothetical protein CC2G_000923 [Coprinopsis cinerea AmutBmut pab1-1]
MAEPSWQEVLRVRLAERNEREAVFAGIIEQYRRLAQQTKLLKERNASLLRAVNTVKGNPNASTVLLASTGEENPVQAAYISSLESQISSLRDELATVYKTQSQNSQRLLSMNETLREKEELIRIEAESHRRAKEELAVVKKKVDQHNELMAEKDRTVQILHDEISTLQLELAMAGRQAGRSEQDERSEPVLRGDAHPVGKRGASPQQPTSDQEGWSVVSERQDSGSDAEWLIVDDESESSEI